MKITQADALTIWIDPIQTNCAPTFAIPTIFRQDALPYTTLSIYSGFVEGPNMMDCIPGGLVKNLKV